MDDVSVLLFRDVKEELVNGRLGLVSATFDQVFWSGTMTDMQRVGGWEEVLDGP